MMLRITGASPWEHTSRSADDPGAKVDSYSELEMMMLQILHGDELRETTKAALAKADGSNESARKAYTEALSSVMEKYREEVQRELRASNTEAGASRLAGKGCARLVMIAHSNCRQLFVLSYLLHFVRLRLDVWMDINVATM